MNDAVIVDVVRLAAGKGKPGGAPAGCHPVELLRRVQLVITGGAGGIGLACARELADRGRLLLVDLGEDQLEAARTALTAEGASVETLRCDVTSPADTAAFISGCDIRVDGGLVGAGKHMLGVG